MSELIKGDSYLMYENNVLKKIFIEEVTEKAYKIIYENSTYKWITKKTLSDEYGVIEYLPAKGKIIDVFEGFEKALINIMYENHKSVPNPLPEELIACFCCPFYIF